MNPLSQHILFQLIQENNKYKEIIALFPGGFKPPTISHFHIVDEISKKPEINKVKVLIGHKNRDGITKEQSLKIWDIYKKYLSPKVEINISNNASPVKDVYEEIKNNPQNFYFTVFGRDEDFERYKNITKYDNIKIIDFKNFEIGISGTLARNEINSNNYEKFQKFIPLELSVEERKEIWNILKPSQIQENKLNNSSGYKKILFYLDKLVTHCCEELNIPRPKIIIDPHNYTKYNTSFGGYVPGENKIYLVVKGRNCSDVMRSCSHEIYHAYQDFNNMLTPESGKDGSEHENQANSFSGKTMREFNRKYPEILNISEGKYFEENQLRSNKLREEYTQYILNELFEKDLPNIKKLNDQEYLVGNGDDIEAKYYFRAENLSTGWWSIHWNFTENNSNKSPEAWKQVTATSYKIIQDFIKTKNPSKIEISGNTPEKTNIYKSKSYLEKLENIFNNQYSINVSKYKVDMELIEILAKNNIKKRMETLNESYDQSLNYWQNLDINAISKIERWDAIKRKVKREVLWEIYNIK